MISSHFIALNNPNSNNKADNKINENTKNRTLQILKIPKFIFLCLISFVEC